MRFDTVIGNPPYNNLLYIKFLYDACGLAKNDVVMIVPSKYLFLKDNEVTVAEAGTFKSNKLNQVNEKYLKDVIYYKNAKDIFDIRITNGIAISHYDKHKSDTKLNIDNYDSRIGFKRSFKRDYNDTNLLDIDAYNIVKYLGDYEKYDINCCNETSGYWKVYINNKYSGSTSNRKGPIRYVTGCRLVNDDMNVNIPEVSICIFSSDNYDEAYNFYTWVTNKFTQYFTSIAISRQSPVYCLDNLRYIPAPDIINGQYDFSHAYSKDYLYRKYKLKDEHIKIIESEVKEIGINGTSCY